MSSSNTHKAVKCCFISILTNMKQYITRDFVARQAANRDWQAVNHDRLLTDLHVKNQLARSNGSTCFDV